MVSYTKYCPLRGFYYKLNNNEVYIDNFIVENLLANLFSHILKVNSIKNVYKELDELLTYFPQYTKLMKVKIEKFTLSNLKNTKKGWLKEDFWIPNNMQEFNYTNKLINDIMVSLGMSRKDAISFIFDEILPKVNCSDEVARYCPYRDRCKEVTLNN